MRFFLGAYATTPTHSGWDAALETRWMQGLQTLPGLRGLEYPFFGGLHPHDERWLAETLPSDWDLVLTLLPGEMNRMAETPAFGLASDDPGGRAAALAFAGQAREAVRQLNALAGRARVLAVEIHSLPRLQGSAGHGGSAGALAASLAELSSWDWDGAVLSLEHCDAFRPDLPPQKGFLSFADELEVVRSLQGQTRTPVGLAINWARSVIEARSGTQARQQIAAAAACGLLQGVMFSGCTDQEATPWGSWVDNHMPQAPEAGRAGAAGSLLTQAVMQDCAALIAAAVAAGTNPPLLFVGGKVTARPAETGLEDRLALNAAMLETLAECFGMPAA